MKEKYTYKMDKKGTVMVYSFIAALTIAGVIYGYQTSDGPTKAVVSYKDDAKIVFDDMKTNDCYHATFDMTDTKQADCYNFINQGDIISVPRRCRNTGRVGYYEIKKINGKRASLAIQQRKEKAFVNKLKQHQR